MKTMKWLLHREFWEHKGAFFWAPIVIALAMIVLIGGGMIYGLADGHMRQGFSVNGHQVQIADIPAPIKAKVVGVATGGYLAMAAPLFAVLPVVVFFYCLAALYDDRRDRSILFWKSLPMSDQMTVLSKVVTALVVAPLITIVIGIATSLFLLVLATIGASFKGLNLFGALLSSPDLYLAPLQLVALLPVYILWALPTVGWLLLVSSWARSKVFLWAVGVPLLTLLMLKWFNFLASNYSDTIIDTDWFTGNVIVRGLGGLVPGVWLMFGGAPEAALKAASDHGMNVGHVVSASWMSLGQPGVWVAAAAGVAMLFAAVRMRRWRDEG